jgi:hypothetical protein
MNARHKGFYDVICAMIVVIAMPVAAPMQWWQ